MIIIYFSATISNIMIIIIIIIIIIILTKRLMIITWRVKPIKSLNMISFLLLIGGFKYYISLILNKKKLYLPFRKNSNFKVA